MKIGPSMGMLREMVKKKKIKSIKTKVKFNKPSEMNNNEDEEDDDEDESQEPDNDEDDEDDDNSLQSHVADDMQDEEEGIKTYGKRQKQHPKKKSIFARMQKDERKHLGLLSRMRK